jgi:hypothetical protein
VTIDPDIWKSRLGHHVDQMRASSGYDTWSWTEGGCFAFASAFQAAFGGELFGVCRVISEDDLPVDHALVELDGVLYDFDGPFDTASIRDDQVIRRHDDDYVCWFEDDFFDDEGWAEIHAVLADCATSLAPASVQRANVV